MTPLYIVTIVYNGMPFITWHYKEFCQLKRPWIWSVVEGVAAPEHCTSWCAPIVPGVSDDGTHNYLKTLSAFDPRVRHHPRVWWHGKVSMFNEALNWYHSPGHLLQVDADEIWTAENIEESIRRLDQSDCDYSYFRCRYFVGPNIYITSKNKFGDRDYEWVRLWKFHPSQRFDSHEPPVLRGQKKALPKAGNLESAFDHFAFASENQLRVKEIYYGSINNEDSGKLYENATENWRKLQRNTFWPVKDLAEFIPWVGPGVSADKI